MIQISLSMVDITYTIFAYSHLDTRHNLYGKSIGAMNECAK